MVTIAEIEATPMFCGTCVESNKKIAEKRSEKPKSSIEELLTEFKNDTTKYELTEKSEDDDDDDDANYDSFFFSEVSGEQSPSTTNPKVKKSLSAQCSPKASKRVITFKKKCIAKWAENKESINKLLLYQNANAKSDAVFGTMTTDCVSLADVFGSRKRYEYRGSSANWKNEYWTPIEIDRCQKHYKGYHIEKDVEKLKKRLDMDQAFPPLCEENSEEGAKDELDPFGLFFVGNNNQGNNN